MKEINEIREVLHTNHEIGQMDTKEYYDIEQALKNIEDRLNSNEVRISRLVAVNEALKTESEILEQEEEQKDFLPSATVADVFKNKILHSLHANLSLEQLEQLQQSARELIAPITFKEVY